MDKKEINYEDIESLFERRWEEVSKNIILVNDSDVTDEESKETEKFLKELARTMYNIAWLDMLDMGSKFGDLDNLLNNPNLPTA
jgi:oligoribonuclease NrnB/cAMP/cGMP phosphodiesterase (DHH superfamily)